MKKILILLLATGMVMSCKNKESETIIPEESEQIAVNYQSYGEEITDEGIVKMDYLYEKFKGMEVGDTLDVKIIAKVKEVCQKKGCWMKVDMDGEEAMIRFKDYGFFMPMDIAGQEIIAEGQAYLEELSVDALRHYAEDGGATPEEALAITEPELTYSFKAHGVLIPEVENQ